MLKAFCWVGTLLVLGVFLSACRPDASNAAPAPTLNSRAAPLQVFVEPEAGRQPVLAALNGAQKSIRMEMYLLTDREIIDALKVARGRGVEVRVLLEAQPSGGGPGNRPAINELQAANVTVKTSNPAYKLTHEKAIVIDDRVALIMTFDQTRLAYANNREFGVIDTNPEDVAEMTAVFEADWKHTTPTLSNPNLVWSPVNARQRILVLIDSATQTLDIETEEMQDEEIETHLIAAAQRGVAVRVVMSPPQSRTDANAPGQEKITRGGVKLRMLKLPFIHAKMMIADNARAFVGSENLSTASLDFNRELGILITDPKIVQTLAGTFANDWNIGK